MELRNYANECYMRVRRNDLRKDIENGYISHEQANQYLAEYAYELKYPDKKPDKTVIQFITDAITSVDRKNSDDVLYDFFHAGYCKEGLLDFLHIPGKVFNASQEYIDNAIEIFKKDLIESYHVTLL